MAFKVTCEGVDAATFYNEEKAYDYVRYALSKDDCNNVSISTVDDNGQPVAATTAPQQADQTVAPQGPQVIQ